MMIFNLSQIDWLIYYLNDVLQHQIEMGMGIGQILPLLKGLRNGLEYGSRVRFVHSLVMIFLFKRFNAKTVKFIFRNAWEHGKKLGTFVFFYKLVCLVLQKATGYRPFNSFIAGSVVGGLVFGKKTPINYQINLYLLSRITVALVQLLYSKHFPQVLEGKQEEQEAGKEQQEKLSFKIMAGVVWGIVMWLFYANQQVLQQSLASSMKDLYIDSERPIRTWKELIPYSRYK